ncbi:MAG: hypothetical protein EXR08_00185 [Alphaproteobacteria bacterium]|nr:hypothetical protein [Alphaproteobacteria bacterium]
MRTLSGLVILILVILGGAYLEWPEQLRAGWTNFTSRAQDQIKTELATLEQIRLGKIKLGAEAEMAARPAPMVIISTEPDHGEAGRQVKTPQKSADRKASHRSSAEKGKPPVSQAGVAPRPAVPVKAPASPAAVAAPAMPENGAPETALGAILKHEVRENQVKEDTFWTRERIQQALKNGPPNSSNSACLAFCDKKDTPIEINMPKTPAGPP